MKVAVCISFCIGSFFSLGRGAAERLERAEEIAAGAASQLAMIDGHDGAPVPERWHFLIHDPTAENGLREFVVAGREIVADRDVSQFVTQLTSEEVIGKAVKIDSSTVGRLVQRYAEANDLTVATMNFRLKKDELTEQPVWVVACANEQGGGIATLVVDAVDGRVLGHEGFAVVPPSMPARTRLARRDEFDGWDQSDLPPVFEGPRDEERRSKERRSDSSRRSPHTLPDPIDLLRRLLPF